MKRMELSAIGLGLLTSVGLLTGEQAYAGENDHPTKCTQETLNGQYLEAGNGMLIPPRAPVWNPSGSPVVSNRLRCLFDLQWRRHRDRLCDIHRQRRQRECNIANSHNVYA
jgi:hypothetical protein